MNCGKCDSPNDAGSLYCENCGSVLADGPRKKSRSYLYALLLLPVLAIAGVLGYYKFILPGGIAAEVNGEEISLSELDARLKSNGALAGLPADMRSRVRYAALSELITERIAMQEARNAGVRLAPAEMRETMESMRAAAGLDEQAFEARVKERYGSMQAYRQGLERRLLIRKFIEEKVTAGARDAADSNDRMNRWLQGATAKAAVRIALEEQLPSSGCGCCNGGRGPANPGVGKTGCGSGKGCVPKRGPGAGAGDAKAAQAAALAYWQQKNGSGPVEARVTDFGCHIQVDIIAHNKIARSLRYQNGTISEM